MKKQISVYIDEEVVKTVRQLGFNLSALVERLLREEIKRIKGAENTASKEVIM